MNEIYGDFWIHLDENEYNAIVCTINGVVKNNNNLVMGAGIAKQFAEEFPWLPMEWGRRVKEDGLQVMATLAKPCESINPLYLVGLPTKYHWKDDSDISLIENSMLELKSLMDMMGWKKVLMTRPGCANGGLDWKWVRQRLFGYLDDDRITVINNGR